MTSRAVLEALIVTAEIYGKQFSEAAAHVFAADLADYPEKAVLAALTRCRRELKGFPCIGDIIARIDDGRPGPEEAWAMIPQDESGSVVWTDEMAGAFGTARHLLEEDPIAARMAFKESYQRLVSDARAERRPVKWSPSLGHDRAGREAALVEAVTRGRLSLEYARRIDPMIMIEGPKSGRLGFDPKNLLPEMPK